MVLAPSGPWRYSVTASASAPFANDDGSIDPVLAEALTTKNQARIIAALSMTRVLTAIAESEEEIPSDCDDNLGTLMLRGADGRKALLSFSSLETLTSFSKVARPMPLFTTEAARAAKAEGAEALLLDLGTEHFTVVEGDDFEALAAGLHLVETEQGFAWIQH